MSKAGFVYLLGNPAMPCCYKIGMTEYAPSRRAKELSSSTAVPEPFSVICYIETEDCLRIEQELHQFLSDFRINCDREFFRFLPAHMAWVIGIFKFHPEQIAYVECEFDGYVPPDMVEDDPWHGRTEEPRMSRIAPHDGYLRLVA